MPKKKEQITNIVSNETIIGCFTGRKIKNHFGKIQKEISFSKQ